MTHPASALSASSSMPGRVSYRPPATDSPTSSTGWPDACWCTACCSAWVSCCCTRPARACCCSRSARSPGGSSTATCRVAGGAPWWSDGRLELRVREGVDHQVRDLRPDMQDHRIRARGVDAVRQQDDELIALGVQPE